MDKNSKKVAFRPRNLDVHKKMVIYLSELPKDLHLYCADNEDISNISSGMEKAEEMEHHLQQAMSVGSAIPIPIIENEVNYELYKNICPQNYELPPKLIQIPSEHIDQYVPDYDMDSSDEIWLQSQSKNLNLTPLKFEEMIDKLEKETSKTVPSLTEAKIVLKQPHELTIVVYDYWLGKRLKTGHPMLFTVKKEEYNTKKFSNNPYVAFRRRFHRGEKMKTRRDRKSDHIGFGKMLKLRKDLMTVEKLLGMIKRREESKKERLILGGQIFEKQYKIKDFNIIHDVMSSYNDTAARIRFPRPALIPMYSNNYWNQMYDEINSNQREFNKLYYKSTPTCTITSSVDANGFISYDVKPRSRTFPTTNHSHEIKMPIQRKQNAPKRYGIKCMNNKLSATIQMCRDDVAASAREHNMYSNEDESYFSFYRNVDCNYHEPKQETSGKWPFNNLNKVEHGYSLTSIRNPSSRCIGFARRRIGRGGRVVLDRIPTNFDKFWTQSKNTDTEKITTESSSNTLETSIDSNSTSCEQLLQEINTNFTHFRPATPEPFIEEEFENDQYIFESDLELFGINSNLDYCGSFQTEFFNNYLNENHEKWNY